MQHPANAAQQTVEQCDFPVLGGRPGGAKIAALPAARGRDVVLSEKARHPRFHIDESLRPTDFPPVEKVFRTTPLGSRLLAFKVVYYLRNLFNPRRTLSAWKKRRQMLHTFPVGPTPE